MTPEELTTSLQWRYATKVFDTEKTIAPDTWSTLEESMILTPSSFGLQPWKFITITCKKTKQDLLEHSWHQRQVTDCSHMVVLCARDGMNQKDIDKWLDQLAECAWRLSRKPRRLCGNDERLLQQHGRQPDSRMGKKSGLYRTRPAHDQCCRAWH